MYANPTLEYQYISDWIAGLINTEISPRQFARRLAAHLNRYHPIRIKVHFNDILLDPGDFTIGAEYDPDLDENKKKQFIIRLIVNHPKHMPMLITGDFADRFTIEIVEALVHEYQHQHQYRSRKHMLNRGYTSKHKDIKIRADQEYLGSPDEIDAYAANIAARFYIIEQLNTNEPVESLDLLGYHTAFGQHHPVVKRLMKKIVKNLINLRENEHAKTYRRSTKQSRNRRV
jgi:hypothetical protein